MNVFQNNIKIDLTEKIHEAEHGLKTKHILNLTTNNVLDHIGAFVAWKNVGGNILIKSPSLSDEHKSCLDIKVKNYNLSNSVCFHTSGTTGVPKLVVHKEQQFNEALKMSKSCLEYDVKTKFINFIPGSTSGFWHIVLPAIYSENAELHLGSLQTIKNDLESNCNLTVIVPAIIDYLRVHKIPVNFSKYNKVAVGASAVFKRHSDFLFENSCKKFIHMYGATEICSPILARETTHNDDCVEYLELTPRSNSEFRIVDNILQVKGQSLCENFKDFDHEGDYFITNDMFERKGNLIKFLGRSNEVVKVNGNQVSLVYIESLAESNFNLGEVLAVPRHTSGSDYLELFYTNIEANIDRKHLIDFYKNHLPKFAIPRKFTYIEKIPKNELGKKTRSNFKTDIQ